MITVPADVRIYSVLDPTDMRKGFDGLLLLVREMLRADPFSVDLERDSLKPGSRVQDSLWALDLIQGAGWLEASIDGSSVFVGSARAGDRRDPVWDELPGGDGALRRQPVIGKPVG